MIKLSLKIKITLSKLVIACIGSATMYGIGCYISKLNDSHALENDISKTQVHIKYLPKDNDEKS